MKTHVHISFDSDRVPGGAQVVLNQAQCGPDVAEIDHKPAIRRTWAEVTLEENDPRLRILLDLLKQHNVNWSEDHDDVYTDEELDRASLLVVQPTIEIMIRAGVEYGTTYDLTGTCPACGTSAQQTSSLFIDAEDLHYFEGRRMVPTDCLYLLVDAELEADLVRTGATGMFFRDVYAVGPRYRSRKIPFRQLCSQKTLPPVAPSTTGLRLDRPCKVCWRNGCSGDSLEPRRLIYRAVDLEGADDVNMSWENLYPGRLEPELKESLLSPPAWMVVTPKIFRVFRDAGLTCFDWTPVRVEDGPSISPEERRRYILEHADTLVLPPMVMEDDDDPAESDEDPETPEPSADESAPTRGFMAEPVMQGFKRRYEALQDKPTEEELDRARLLLIDALWHDWIPGGVPYGTTYDLSSACPACSSGARQTSSAFVDGEKLDFLQGHRVGMTSARQCLVDIGLAKALEREGISGLSLRDVFAVMRDGSHVELPWKQICAARTLPPMAPSTTGLIRAEGGCDQCRRDNYGIELEQPMRIVYRHADLRDIDDVNLTWENLGRGVLENDLRDGKVPAPLLLVTPKVRRIFLAARGSSFHWRPIHVEEG